MNINKKKYYIENGMVKGKARSMSLKAYKKQMAYKQDYDKEVYRRLAIRLRKDKEKELIDFCEVQESVNALVIRLLREEYEKQCKSGEYTPLLAK